MLYHRTTPPVKTSGMLAPIWHALEPILCTARRLGAK